MVVVGLEELDYRVLSSLLDLYRVDPVTHVYLAYDLLEQPERIELYVVVEGGRVEGYLLRWRGPVHDGVHVWGRAGRLLGMIGCDRPSVIQVHSPGLLPRVLDALRGRATVGAETYLDMVVGEEGFRPYRGPGVVRLNPLDPDHVGGLVELKRVQGVSLGFEEAREAIRSMRYHGVFVEGRLVSIAGSYVRTPRVWVVGDVYTHPAYRGRGLARAVTSSVTADALAAGAVAALHVAKANAAAIRVYRALGYRVVAEKPWVRCSPRA